MLDHKKALTIDNIYGTAGMDIWAGSVSAGPNLTGRMDPGTNIPQAFRPNIWEADMFVILLGIFNFFTVLFKVNVGWTALTWSFKGWKHNFKTNVWRANMSGVQIGAWFFYHDLKKIIFAILFHSGGDIYTIHIQCILYKFLAHWTP